MARFLTSKQKKIRKIRRWICFIAIVVGLYFLNTKYNYVDKITKYKEMPFHSEVNDTVMLRDTVFQNVKNYSDSIRMERVDNNYYTFVYVDGIRIKGQVDSGCSVGLSGGTCEYNFLKKYAHIKETGKSNATLASGDTVLGTECVAYNIRVGNMTIDSIVCLFIESDNAEVLIGQEILMYFESINYNKDLMYF